MDAFAAHSAVSRLEAKNAAAGCRYANRTSCVGTDRKIHELGRDGDRRAARGSTRHPVRVARVDGRTGPEIDSRHAVGKFVHVGVAANSAPSLEQRFYYR